ncbi:MAG: Imidazole glycerol phosphate synthase subunit HisH [Candidatus Magasanikbacteria bacterium GW2011_GWC2_41_17]|uniref:Imidazole glycerol phosphate synthase subunit HisH n=2 Tax=Candidatus Magasanikiibacteriota TaxID=1752731 RepID=A0A0G0YVE6_9BACT|nr:MAG: Imidazole glycerol phosphate synthase subunit HisH [Candidatus Magasanikbacteria bacterium GW2011_GWC2_41_17]KKS13636.1 MAG: Imidazole glycerol phosphate synthase subunit HisH [Candidatus Magasanikbacteria bacterium GW2011_GWA2_41_55]
MNGKLKIAIVDYGVGNLQSVQKAMENFNVEVFVTEEPEVIKKADALILPGVGSFEAGVKGLQLRGLVDVVREFAGQNKPMLGICLGAQLMLTQGYEFGIFQGLDIIAGKVVRFSPLKNQEKVPHVGWNTIYPPKNLSWSETILNNLEDSQVYFVHSYILEPNNTSDILSLTAYGGQTFCSAVKRGNIYGCQFHPEKSGVIGLSILENFINSI